MFNLVMQNYISPCSCNPFAYGVYGSGNAGLDFLSGMLVGFGAARGYTPMPVMPMVSCSYTPVYAYSPSVFMYSPCPVNPFSAAYTPCSYYGTLPALPVVPSFSYNSSLVIPQGYSTITTQTTKESPKSQTSTVSQKTNTGSDALVKIKNSALMKNVPQQRKERILAAVENACKKYDIDPDVR